MTVKYNFKYKPFDHQQVALDHGCYEEDGNRQVQSSYR
jgi:hypothetical protein